MMHYYNTNMAIILFLFFAALAIVVAVHLFFVAVFKFNAVALLERYFEDDEYDGY